ncbi:hypothetical protein KIMH_08390 [Bombiscardovia apis]|uniref:N-acetyltransferase domain-containing protein n=1 Tax=Bombiscardovia apis TaxID=2932182 RepID=A0ABN6SGH3_9BIFI|nr:GNAT family N-acetyltransferase [Bombiscardovia apis]BDR54728.1 hypothetical protein KIMH_08390 [Bombiscardovia apis]
MRLRPYRRHEDDARLIELAQEDINTRGHTGLSEQDAKLFARQRFAEELGKEMRPDENVIVIAIADSHEEITALTAQSTVSTNNEEESSDNNQCLKPSHCASRIMAFIKLEIRPDSVTNRPEGFIHHLCIDQRCKNTRLSAALINDAQHWAQRNGLYKLSLDLDAADEASISLYEASGFHVSSVSMEIPCLEPER